MAKIFAVIRDISITIMCGAIVYAVSVYVQPIQSNEDIEYESAVHSLLQTDRSPDA